MNILVLAHNDSDNVMICNVLYELESRKHKIRLFTEFLDERTNRMFYALNAEIKNVDFLLDDDIDWCDCILSALRAHINIGRLGEKAFSKKYIFIYNHYIDNTWYTAGADFMFTCGYTRHMDHEEDCPTMAIGCPKNDHDGIVIKSGNKSKTFLFIDSGHYPFSHRGKKQVAILLLDIAKKFSDYKLIIKPRFLPEDSNMLHSNSDHLYYLINEMAIDGIPKNLIFLYEHRDMQEMIDQSDCVLMLCTSAYVDVALRNKPMLIIEGIDNEDKYELRNDIEYKNIFDLRRKSGCVVNYKDVSNYLPEGLKCKQEHLKELVAYPQNASKRMVDVMEHVVNTFLACGRFPKIQKYEYESYKQKMIPDDSLNWDIILHKRLKNYGNDTLNLFNRIVNKIDISEYIHAIDYDYNSFDVTEQGFFKYQKYLDDSFCDLIIENKDVLMNDRMDQGELLRAMYRRKKYTELFSVSEDDVLCEEPWLFYTGMVLAKEGNATEGIKRLVRYIQLSAQRSFAKYDCENWYGYKDAFEQIIRLYDGSNIDSITFANLYIILYKKGVDKYLSDNNLNKLIKNICLVRRELERLGEYKLSSKCADCYFENTVPVYENNRIVVAERLAKSENERITNSLSYKIGMMITMLPRKIRKLCKWIKKKALLKTITGSLPFKAYYSYKHKINQGFKKYATLLKTNCCKNMLISAGGTGDVYIANMFLKQYVREKNIENDYVYVTPGLSCTNTTTLFDIENVCQIAKENWEQLLHLYRFIGEDSGIDVLYYHIHIIYTQYTEALEGLHGWNLFNLMKQIHFDNIDIKDADKPTFRVNSSEEMQLFSNNKLIEGKTVILCPYAKWPPKIENDFWQKLAFKLKKKGYCVCTNSVGEVEPVIDGTVPVFFSYDISVPFIEKCGYIVGLRSGLLDIIETAKAKKVALYPYNCAKRGLVNGKAMSSFSLNAMFEKDDFLELETALSNLNEIIEKIVDYFEDSGVKNENNNIYANQA